MGGEKKGSEKGSDGSRSNGPGIPKFVPRGRLAGGKTQNMRKL